MLHFALGCSLSSVVWQEFLRAWVSSALISRLQLGNEVKDRVTTSGVRRKASGARLGREREREKIIPQEKFDKCCVRFSTPSC